MKKLLAFVLAAIMAISGLSVTTFAEEYEYDDIQGVAYISISDDDKYVTSDGVNSGTIMAYIPINLADLLNVKLENYNLEDFYYDADGDGKYEITVLQLFLYVLDTYYSGTAKSLTISGSAGHMYMQNGFWGHDENLLYYVNGDYPMDPSLGPNMGATADRIPISDTDFIDVTMYTSWSFYSDPAAGFHYFTDPNGEITHEYKAEEGKPLAINYIKVFGNVEQGTTGTNKPSANSTIYYGKTLYDKENAETVTTDANGKANITFDRKGIYYLWAYGEYGTEEGGCENDIVSSPSYCKVVVEGGSAPEILYGDVNGDGKVSSADAAIAYASHRGKVTLNEKQKVAADVNGDGKVNSADAALIYAYHRGKLTKFPVENK